ncbi:hypothetical protein ACH427_27585 [Streptomyces sp. NPDC020379]|uniref:hypothetical protein n=1 Tax=Streptomyces sp. NPDC020379 TaxID=3365071 RepID=UPI00378A962B
MDRQLRVIPGTMVLAGLTASALLTGCDSPSGPAAASASPTRSAPSSVSLATPQSLASGRYERAADTPELTKRRAEAQKSLPAGVTSVVAVYNKPDDADSALTLSGSYGKDLGDARAVLDAMFGSLGFSQASPSSSRQTFPPAGPNAPDLQCETVKVREGVFAPVCAWAQKTDAALLLATDPKQTTANAVDLPAFAKTAATVYTEIRQPEH